MSARIAECDGSMILRACHFLREEEQELEVEEHFESTIVVQNRRILIVPFLEWQPASREYRKDGVGWLLDGGTRSSRKDLVEEGPVL